MENYLGMTKELSYREFEYRTEKILFLISKVSGRQKMNSTVTKTKTTLIYAYTYSYNVHYWTYARVLS